jgi:predicted O-methyltransferase YrrM
MGKLIDYFKTDNKVKIIKSSTIDFLNNLEKDYLDIVYIDADHSYTSVLNDLELSYLKIKTGGMICGHDYVPKTEAEKAVNDFCIKFNVNIDYITKDGCPSFCITKK